MKIIKRVFMIFIILIILIILGILISLSAPEKEDDSFYVKSRNVVGDGGAKNVIDALIENKQMTLDDSATIIVKVGFGGGGKQWLDGTENTWLSIEAEGCVINGQSDVYEKKYEDFYTNDIYRHSEKEQMWNYPEMTPNYYEEIEIAFPKSVCSGKLSFVLYDQIDEWSIIPTEVKIYYAKTDEQIAFSEESVDMAAQLLDDK